MMKAFIGVLSALSLVLSSALSIRAQEKKADADAEFLIKVVPSIAAFDDEVKNGSDPALKTYAQNSITAGNEHLSEARELLAKMKK